MKIVKALFISILFFPLVISFPLSLSASDYKTLLDLPPGVTLLNISASVREEVTQDLLIAKLRYESRHKDARVVQDEINKKMAEGVAQAKKHSTVKVSTLGYNVYQTQMPPNRSALIWVGSQVIEIKSKDSDSLLQLTGELQNMGFVLSNLSYVVSPELYEQTQDALMEKALARLQERAVRAAKALGKTEADIAEIVVDSEQASNSQRFERGFMLEAAADTASMSTPVAEAGESNISLTVNARVLLKP